MQHRKVPDIIALSTLAGGCELHMRRHAAMQFQLHSKRDLDVAPQAVVEVSQAVSDEQNFWNRRC